MAPLKTYQARKFEDHWKNIFPQEEEKEKISAFDRLLKSRVYNKVSVHHTPVFNNSSEGESFAKSIEANKSKKNNNDDNKFKDPATIINSLCTSRRERNIFKPLISRKTSRRKAAKSSKKLRIATSDRKLPTAAKNFNTLLAKNIVKEIKTNKSKYSDFFGGINVDQFITSTPETKLRSENNLRKSLEIIKQWDRSKLLVEDFATPARKPKKNKPKPKEDSKLTAKPTVLLERFDLVSSTVDFKTFESFYEKTIQVISAPKREKQPIVNIKKLQPKQIEDMTRVVNCRISLTRLETIDPVTRDCHVDTDHSIVLNSPAGESGVMSSVGETEVADPIGESEVASPVSELEVASPIGETEVASPVGESEVASPVRETEVTNPFDESGVSSPVDDSFYGISTENEDESALWKIVSISSLADKSEDTGLNDGSCDLFSDAYQKVPVTTRNSIKEKQKRTKRINTRKKQIDKSLSNEAKKCVAENCLGKDRLSNNLIEIIDSSDEECVLMGKNPKSGQKKPSDGLQPVVEDIVTINDDDDDVEFVMSGRVYEANEFPLVNSSIMFLELSHSGLSGRLTDLQKYAKHNESVSYDSTVIIGNQSIVKKSPMGEALILQRCKQKQVLDFSLLPDLETVKCKIGEGISGEVFSYLSEKSILKIIPIGGLQIINGEKQKTYNDILTEIIVTMELSNLRECVENRTECFVRLKHVNYVKGSYPENLLKLWDDYDRKLTSENDRPSVLKNDQHYIVFSLENGGDDLEKYVFKNAMQALSAFKQIACALAVAESELEFEHRDLHWGNVLVAGTDKRKAEFSLNGEKIIFPSEGVRVTIIDYTQSRFKYDDVVMYYDLKEETELFEGTGDYQMDIYREMKKLCNNKWSTFNAYTNVLWLHYCVDKMLTKVHYSSRRSPAHMKASAILKLFKETLLSHKSSTEFVEKNFV